MKKTICILLATTLSFGISVTAFAKEVEKQPKETKGDFESIAPYAILVEQSTGEVLYEKNADEKLPPASITKVMTLLLTMEALERGDISLEDKVTTSTEASKMGGSQIWLKEGEVMTVDELLKAATISSANDASYALAELVGTSHDGFINMMNNRAKELGMDNTHFVNCTGLDAEGHLTTARDIATMSNELIKHDKIKEYSTVWMDSLRGGETELVNTNRLIKTYKGTTGLKTGTTNDAGKCLSATAQREDLALTAVVLGLKTSEERFKAAKDLLDYGFGNYYFYKPENIDQKLENMKVKNGVQPETEVYAKYPKGVLVPLLDSKNVTQNIVLDEFVTAPVNRGQQVGKVEIMNGDKKVKEYPICAKEDICEMTVGKAFGILFTTLTTNSNSNSSNIK